MKVKKFVIQYHFCDGREFLGCILFDSFKEALLQLCYINEHKSGTLVGCDGVIVKFVEFGL